MAPPKLHRMYVTPAEFRRKEILARVARISGRDLLRIGAAAITGGHTSAFVRGDRKKKRKVKNQETKPCFVYTHPSLLATSSSDM
jgi:hypothetical protein